MNGDKFDILIDTVDLEMLETLNLSWHVAYYKKIQGYYACATHYHRNTATVKHWSETILLHRVICNCDTNDNIYIDHINHDTLDNRKENLRITINEDNSKNRKSKNSNNHSGYRNVCRIHNKWHVQMQVDGIGTLLKKFPLNQLEEAGAYAKEMREKYYGDFQGS